MKGLILCAGRGTRLYPLSYSQPKTLLPVANLPVIQHCLQKLLDVGIREIGIVISPNQLQIPAYVGNGQKYGAVIRYIEQQEPLGIAHAVSLAESFIAEDKFALFLGDNLMMESLHSLHDSFIKTDAYAAVLLSEVEKPQDFGIAEVQGEQIQSIVEKPQFPKSNLAVIGAYFFTPAIFQVIAGLQPSKRGEYEITDAIAALLQQGKKVVHSTTKLPYSDVGTMERWLEANRWMLDKSIGDEVQVGEGSMIDNCEIIGPVMIGENCLLSNCTIGPYVCIQNGAEVRNCQRIENSILLEDTKLVNLDCYIHDSIFGRSSYLVGGVPNVSRQDMGIFIMSDHSTITLPATRRIGVS
ncbi:glucose-1-phosphate thymidylyltransferase [Brevibacillus laterosporus]|uniref:glucose-1-phosphate thymidylyltransferase n=1 Tax=Brevibacillus TaxID=55080 RepID=UPI000240397E|nr:MULTISPECIES: glucose-1-phosphate thymidylyltransferase [Brevibacillus]AUM64874.1 glucose-1-phosphate thymidylyltransferase [Brevibacillus laterosporus]MCR8964558.1 glucose-1-phosphate thymidylyltransferase [Brevibacillus laterosporus]MCZ0836713.1 glucose-1-phosphate thymidylyltransferase [Brevibacillus halotolerans]PCN43521.1 glucose-1-phosphate thymidylyltransferase [Brevibacillus laterosporus]CCF14110.1 glucose-1-phosphate thymidylyltransferase [Brevibacillus laterosporus GI-9]